MGIIIILGIAIIGWILIPSIFWAIIFEIVLAITLFFLMSQSNE